jgi:phosphoribosylanthranilate isomerase
MPVEIKICGMTNDDDVAVALEAGVDYVGFVLYDQSPRGVTPERVRRIVERADTSIRAVGVFVNEPPAYVDQVARDCGLHAVQLHGREAAADFADLEVPLWRAIWVGSHATIEMVPDDWQAERLVIDAAVPGMYGGTGSRADWEQSAQLAARYPVMLAGGLTPANVVAAVEAVKPLGVDVSSGVEAGPGCKDHGRLRDFIKKVRDYDNING